DRSLGAAGPLAGPATAVVLLLPGTAVTGWSSWCARAWCSLGCGMHRSVQRWSGGTVTPTLSNGYSKMLLLEATPLLRVTSLEGWPPIPGGDLHRGADRSGKNGPRGTTLRARGSGSEQGRTGPGALGCRGPSHVCGTSFRPLPDQGVWVSPAGQ